MEPVEILEALKGKIAQIGKDRPSWKRAHVYSWDCVHKVNYHETPISLEACRHEIWVGVAADPVTVEDRRDLVEQQFALTNALPGNLLVQMRFIDGIHENDPKRYLEIYQASV